MGHSDSLRPTTKNTVSDDNDNWTAASPLCRVCGEKGESVRQSECKKLAQKEHKRRHDNVVTIIHWNLCELHQVERKEKWYKHVPEGVVENGNRSEQEGEQMHNCGHCDP